MPTIRQQSLFDSQIVVRAVGDAFRKLNPRHMLRNPVMFVVYLGSILTTLVLFRDVAGGRAGVGFTIQIAIWLWFTVIFANFAEAMAEGRGKRKPTRFGIRARRRTRNASRTQPIICRRSSRSRRSFVAAITCCAVRAT
jgi:K+-transporting ATPase ATPase B chain